MRAQAPHMDRMEDGRLATENLVPGTRVYDEDLMTHRGREYRTWNPTRSKLAAYFLKGGGRGLKLTERTRVLYLGAANGTTPSHMSDISRDGIIWSVEFSPRSFRDLLLVAEPRENMIPLLGDAWRPDQYARFIDAPDLVYQDIAQREQAAIFARNLNRFQPPLGLLMIKSRSVDVAAPPRQVYDNVVHEVQESAPYRLVEILDIGPYEKDHAAALFAKK